MQSSVPLADVPAAAKVPDSVIASARNRITWRLMPYLLLLYFIAFLDRANVGVAKLGMEKELGFDNSIIGFGAGIFFISYFLLEIPGTLIVERWSARKWIARIMISWGIVASAEGLIGLPQFNSFMSPEYQFYGLRFILGLAEAGFFPGIIVYLSHWYRYSDRAKAKAGFMVGLPIASAIGMPLSRWIMNEVHWYGWGGWRWVFILEGIPAVILGFVTLWYLPDWPKDAKWLPADERDWINGELERERREKSTRHDQGVWAATKEGISHPKVLLLAAIYFFIVIGYYGLTFFFPSLVEQRTDLSQGAKLWVPAIPYFFGFIAMLIWARNSDQTGERRLHTATPMLMAAVALALSIWLGSNLAFFMILFIIVGIGVHAYLPVFWTWPSVWLTASASAAAIGLINSVGNLGGFVGPYVVGWLQKSTGSYAAGMAFLVVSIMIAGLLALTLKLPSKK
ncbi:MAG: MFS transporter [Blastocatellia bacterium]